MDSAVDALLQLMQPEVRDGILYKCFCAEFGVRDLSTDELWEMFDVRWEALSEVRLDKGMETFLMRDSIDSEPSTIQLAALDPAGHSIGGLRIHVSPLTLLGGLMAVQISRVGVAWVARGAGIGATLVRSALRIARAFGEVKSLPLVFLHSRILDSTNPNRVLRFYERIGFRRTNLYTVTKGLSNCLMLAGVKQSSLQYLRSQGFQVQEALEQGAIYPTLIIASSLARQIQTAWRLNERDQPSEEGYDAALMRGRLVVIRPLAQADLPTRHHWEHSSLSSKYATMSRTRTSTMSELENEFVLESRRPEKQRFAIETNTGRLIGHLSYDLHHENRSVLLDIFLGEPDCWDGEWGIESLKLLLEYVFNELGIHRAGITVSRLQERLVQDLRRLGFQEDGVLRHHEYVDGGYVDHFVFSLLDEEYQKSMEM